MNYKDTKLEEYILQIKENDNNKVKLSNYKKATKRINQLKKKYNNICKALEEDPESDEEQINMETIIFELNRINTQLEEQTEEIDMSEMIQQYMRYKSLLSKLEIESDLIKNEIFKVDKKKNKISVHRLDPDSIL